MSVIELNPAGDNDRALWHSVADLTQLLPENWTLVGGLMVQLHAVEQGVAEIRATTDIDVLAQARPPRTLRAIDRALCEAGFHAIDPDPDGYAYRYNRDDLVVDVLAPDGIRPPAKLDNSRKAISIPGGSQALARTETVRARIEGREFELRRPTLLGAILIKARSLPKHHDPDSQREDLLLLLSLAPDPAALAKELKRSERRWLRAVEERLRFTAPAAVSPATVQRARQAYRLLTREARVSR
jgi:hypothetical protein